MSLDFVCITQGTEVISLKEGELFSSKEGPVYRDTQKNILEGIIHKIMKGVPWRKVVRECFELDNKWLYDIITHPDRDLFFRLHPLPKGASVLDVGSGWGQISLRLAAQGHLVTVSEPTAERLEFIRVVSEQEGISKNLFFIGCDYQDLSFSKKFDVITCIGTLEWCGKFRDDTDVQKIQLEFLKKIKVDLKEGGYCVVGIENRFGLKYWLGASGDHTGVPYTENMDAKLANKLWKQRTGVDLKVFTYTVSEYQTMFRKAGFTQLKFFAAFPDYKIPQAIVAIEEPDMLLEFILNSRIPSEHDGSNGRLLPDSIQEKLKSHYKSLAIMGVAQYFAPSYFIIAS
jgi:2-polyprenyl-3-methyl-5-hydroxy-6-metoxy-1,4-benzoquinol methylase